MLATGVLLPGFVRCFGRAPFLDLAPMFQVFFQGVGLQGDGVFAEQYLMQEAEGEQHEFGVVCQYLLFFVRGMANISSNGPMLTNSRKRSKS